MRIMVGRSSSVFQRRLELRLEPITEELNRVIRFTIPYTYGNFRFRPLMGRDEVIRYIMADQDWMKNFRIREKFQEIEEFFHITIRYDSTTGMISIWAKNNKPDDPDYDGSKWIRGAIQMYRDEQKGKYNQR